MEKETLNIIIALCTLIVTVATLVFTVKNSKGYLHRKIDKKQEQIRRIEHKEAYKIASRIALDFSPYSAISRVFATKQSVYFVK